MLTSLDVSLNQFTGTIPIQSILQQTSLQRLFLSENPFTNPSSSAAASEWNLLFSSLPHLRELSLRNVNLSGTVFIPPTPPSIIVDDDKQVQFLDLGNNHLTGKLPRTILGETLVSLNFILLDQNNFTGTIPDSVEALTDLAMFYLNDNDAMTGNADPFCFMGPFRPDFLFLPSSISCRCCETDVSGTTTTTTTSTTMPTATTLGNFNPSWKNKFERKTYDLGTGAIFGV